MTASRRGCLAGALRWLQAWPEALPGRLGRCMQVAAGLLLATGLACTQASAQTPLPGSAAGPGAATGPARAAAPASGPASAASSTWAAAAASMPAPLPQRVVHVGLLAEYPPFQLWPQDSVAGGADLSLLGELARRAGLSLQVHRYGDQPTLEADLRAGRIQLASAMARTSARERELLFTAPYIQVPLALLARADQPSASLLPDLAGRSIAVVPGHASQGEADRLFPLAPRVVVASAVEAVRAVREGRADLALDTLPVLTEAAERLGPTGLQVVRLLDAPSGRLHLAAPRSEAELVRRLDAALAALPEGRVAAIVEQWTARPPPAAPPPALTLDAAERALLAAWPAPTVGVVVPDAPFAQLDAQGRPQGLSVDMLQGVLERLGLRAARWQPLAPREVALAVASGRVDLVVGADESALRQAPLRFIGPFLEYPSVLVGRVDGGAFDLAQLRGRRLAVPRQSAAWPFVESRHPAVLLVDCSTLADCLEAVQRGRADATLADLASAAVALSRQPRQGLQIMGAEPALRNDHSLALADRHAALVPLFDRALRLAAEQDLTALKARWFGPPPRAEMLRDAAWRYGPWVALLLLLLGAALAWHLRRLRAEVQRTRAAQLEAEQTAQAKARFTTFLAHEVRNSLHAVLAGTELARMPAAAANGGQVFDLLADSARATLRLLNNLIDRDRLDAGRLVLHLEPARLAPLLQAVAQEMAPAAAACGQSVQVLPVPDDATRLVDPLRLQQVLRNLLANAIKHAGPGSIEIELLMPTRLQPPELLTIEVRDQGPMVDAQVLQKAFEPFGSTAHAENSAGLGLPISRRLAQLMGGDLRLTPRPEGGTVARLQLRGEPAPPPVAPPRRRLQVLVVEDSDVLALLLARAFEQEGHAVQVAGTLAEARLHLAATAFDLLLCDLHLPDGPGASLLAELHGRPGGQPVLVAMTADRDLQPPGSAVPAQVPVLAKAGDARALALQALLRVDTPQAVA